MKTKWTKLLLMAVMSFLAMYALMYIMVDTYSNAYVNLNQLYMVLAMTSAMMLIEIGVMKMYSDKIKTQVIIVSTIILIGSIIFVRNQTGISDREFLKSMITHHASALLMCNKAKINDLEIKKLCSDILLSQESQINWMKAKLLTL